VRGPDVEDADAAAAAVAAADAVVVSVAIGVVELERDGAGVRGYFADEAGAAAVAGAPIARRITPLYPLGTRMSCPTTWRPRKVAMGVPSGTLCPGGAFRGLKKVAMRALDGVGVRAKGRRLRSADSGMSLAGERMNVDMVLF